MQALTRFGPARAPRVFGAGTTPDSAERPELFVWRAPARVWPAKLPAIHPLAPDAVVVAKTESTGAAWPWLSPTLHDPIEYAGFQHPEQTAAPPASATIPKYHAVETSAAD